MANGAELDRLHEDRDMLANVDACGSPVPTARFMGGREYEAIAGDSKASREPTDEALEKVVRQRALALPSFAGTGGPFVGLRGKLLNADKLDERERGALATLYCALQTDFLLELLGDPSPVIIDGPLTENPLFARVLAALRDGPVLTGDNRAGPTECGRLLLGYRPESNLRPARPLDLAGLSDYRAIWRTEATSRLPCADPPQSAQ